MPARSNMDQGAARAWTAAVARPVERHVRRHYFALTTGTFNRQSAASGLPAKPSGLCSTSFYADDPLHLVVPGAVHQSQFSFQRFPL